MKYDRKGKVFWSVSLVHTYVSNNFTLPWIFGTFDRVNGGF